MPSLSINIHYKSSTTDLISSCTAAAPLEKEATSVAAVRCSCFFCLPDFPDTPCHSGDCRSQLDYLRALTQSIDSEDFSPFCLPRGLAHGNSINLMILSEQRQKAYGRTCLSFGSTWRHLTSRCKVRKTLIFKSRDTTQTHCQTDPLGLESLDQCSESVAYFCRRVAEVRGPVRCLKLTYLGRGPAC